MFYVKAFDATMMCKLIYISSEYAALTNQFLYYTTNRLDRILTFTASNMVLVLYSEVSYLSEPKARSRAGGGGSWQEIPEIPQIIKLY